MVYKIEFTEIAEKHLLEWKKSGQKKILQKIATIISELREHPRTGTGKVEQLKGDYFGYWSRRIDKSSRIIYFIDEDKVIVTIVSLKGHYNDK